MGTFGKSTFQLWAGIALMWGWIASLVIVGLPIYESRYTISSILFGKGQIVATRTDNPDIGNSSA